MTSLEDEGRFESDMALMRKLLDGLKRSLSTAGSTPRLVEEALEDTQTFMNRIGDRYMAASNVAWRQHWADQLDRFDLVAAEVERTLEHVYEQRPELRPFD